MYVIDTYDYSIEGKKSSNRDFPLNLVIVILIVIGVVIVLIFFYAKRKPIYTNNSLLATSSTFTGIKMPCNDTIRCTDGNECVATSIGNICLAPIGAKCSNLLECVNSANMCDGRCVAESGGLGSLCTSGSCQDGLICILDTDGKNRCLIPQNSNVPCQSYQECVPNSTCFNGICEAGLEPYADCTSSRECEGNNICLLGKCQPSDISIPGSIGSYCAVNGTECEINLQCQASDGYNLPSDIGYCVKPISTPVQPCNRFIGCVPISTCSSSLICDVIEPNVCFYGKCGPGFTCDAVPKPDAPSGNCLADNNIICNVDLDCLGGNCGNTGINKVTHSSIENLFNWENVAASLPNVFTTLSSIEQNSNGNIITTLCGYTIPNSSCTIISNDGNLTTLSFSFVFPTSGYSLSSVKNVKIYNPNLITYHIEIKAPDDSLFEKIIFRTFSVSSFNSIIDLTTDEIIPYSFLSGRTNITFYNFDFNGNYLYMITNEIDGYSYGPLFSTINPTLETVYRLASTLDKTLLGIYPFTNVYIPEYTTNSILVYGRNVHNNEGFEDAGDGYYLYNPYSFSTFPVNIFTTFYNPLSTFEPRLGLIMSINNSINSFQFFFSYYNSFNFGIFSSYNGYTSFEMNGFVSENQSNILQSLYNPNLMLVSSKTCISS